MKKRTQILALVATLCAGFVLGVGALGNEQITATLNRTININYNGQKQNFTDANGNVVYPISYNGTTYLPVRAVSGLVDLPVDYNAATDTVILGTTEKQPVNLVSLPSTPGTQYSSIIRDAAELKIVGDSATQTYSTGISWNQWNGTMSHMKDRDVDFTVTGYNTLSFSVWSEVDATVGIYDANGNVITNFQMTPGSLISKTIDITGCSTIAFGSNGTDWKSGDGYVKILDPVVS